MSPLAITVLMLETRLRFKYLLRKLVRFLRNTLEMSPLKLYKFNRTLTDKVKYVTEMNKNLVHLWQIMAYL